MPEVVHTIGELRARIAQLRAERVTSARGTSARDRSSHGDGSAEASVALVPTMGALHAGHIALVERAREIAPIVVVSIFVNPLQFGAEEDLSRYPRTLDADVVALGDRADIVFAPSAVEMYPRGDSATRITGGPVASLYEGASRPGHFDGMLTVVAKLLGIVRPNAVLFGRKDAQQLFLVRQMVRDLDIATDVVAIETVREGDGLALSSRNRYLDDEQRLAAVSLDRALSALVESAPRGVDAARAAAVNIIESEPAATLDYLAIVDPETFEQVDDDFSGEALALIAGRVGATRLIDNAPARLSPQHTTHAVDLEGAVG